MLFTNHYSLTNKPERRVMMAATWARAAWPCGLRVSALMPFIFWSSERVMPVATQPANVLSAGVLALMASG